MRTGVMFILVCLAAASYAQQKLSGKTKQKLDNADQLFNKGYYTEAIELYQEVLPAVDNHIPIQLKIAEAFYRQPNKREAEKWYNTVFQRSDVDFTVAALPRHFYNYAEIQLSNEQPAEAMRWYQLYKEVAPADTRTARKIKSILEWKSLKKDAHLYEVNEAPFNSKYTDFSPAFLKNGIAFVSGREEAMQKKTKAQPLTYLDLYYTDRQPDDTFSEVKKLGGAINSVFHEGPAVFYDSSRKVIFTRNNADGKGEESEEAVTVHLHLFYSESMDGVTWKEPKLLSIDGKDYSIGHPAITSDAQQLYFSSNKPGGLGGTDLYMSKWTGNEWGAPESLGAAINTEGDEMFPFIHGDTALYFASNGHGGMGGLDIHRFNMKDQTVTNMGFPVNSPGDDFGLILDHTGHQGYFSSNRNSSGARLDDNIYGVVIKEPLPPAYAAPPVPADTVEVYYTIQILALKKKKFMSKVKVDDIKPVLVHKGKDGFNRYTCGKYRSLQDASEMLQKVKAKGYNDAFVRREVSFKELSTGPGIELNSRQ